MVIYQDWLEWSGNDGVIGSEGARNLQISQGHVILNPQHNHLIAGISGIGNQEPEVIEISELVIVEWRSGVGAC